MIKLAPSILTADFANLGNALKVIEDAGADYAHIDVMDGHFVPNITMGMPIVKSIRKSSNLVFDVHLMISEPERYALQFADAGADIICFHIEACENIPALIKSIRDYGKKPAIAIKPLTPVEGVFEYIKDLDMILVMSVEPGFGGQKFMPHALDKAREIRECIKSNNLQCDIQMDGGIKLENVLDVINSGVNVIVSGTDIFNAPNIKEKICEYKCLFQNR